MSELLIAISLWCSSGNIGSFNQNTNITECKEKILQCVGDDFTEKKQYQCFKRQLR